MGPLRLSKLQIWLVPVENYHWEFKNSGLQLQIKQTPRSWWFDPKVSCQSVLIVCLSIQLSIIFPVITHLIIWSSYSPTHNHYQPSSIHSVYQLSIHSPTHSFIIQNIIPYSTYLFIYQSPTYSPLTNLSVIQHSSFFQYFAIHYFLFWVHISSEL